MTASVLETVRAAMAGRRKPVLSGGAVAVRSQGRGGSAVVALLLAMGAGQAAWMSPARAWDVTPEQQYKTYLTRAQSIEPMAEFGDQISLRDGKLSFRHVDVELAGTGPTLRIIRTTTLDDGLGTAASSGNGMGQWELEIPRIKTITSNAPSTMRNQPLSATSPVGWQVPAADKNARCTNFISPSEVAYPAAELEFLPSNWWFGYQLVDDTGAEQSLFNRTAEMLSPAYKIGTGGHWVVECLASTANGEPGEAFLAHAPDGTKYWFNYLVYTPYDGLTMAFENMPPKGYTLYYTLPRRAASMLVTRVEDRFGNYLTYHYSAGKLTSIVASDGRQVTIGTPGGAIATVTAGTSPETRTWTYQYTDGLKVIQPDGASWQYTGNFGREFFSSFNFENCSQIYTEPTGTRQVSVTAPSGAVASFTLNRRVFGRSYVPKYCAGPSSQSNPDAGYPLTPRLWMGHAIGSKTVTGPGLAPQSWSYTYSAHNGTWAADCTSGTCPSTVWTEVQDATGRKVRSHFSNKWDQTENKLVREETYTSAGVLLGTVEYTYATTPSNAANPYPWPLKIGTFAGYNLNNEVSLRWTPLSKRVTTQDGTQFTYAVTGFDSLTRPVSVTKSSAPAP